MRTLEDAPLAPMTSLRLGGPAKRLVEADSSEAIAHAVRDSDARGEAVLVLGGGSNLVVRDGGFAGTVVRVASRGITVAKVAGDRVSLVVAAGEPWDALVARCVDEGWSGVECLSGIPGLVGATPIQNVGAYGQDVSETIRRVRVLDRDSGDVRVMEAAACGFSYRSSVFKGGARYVVLEVTFELETRADGAGAPVRYAELARALGVGSGARAPLAAVRSTVVALRRGKGMVLDAGDPDSVSAGSFFVNPILDVGGLSSLEACVSARGIDAATLPRFPEADGRTKVSAAWLIERAGFAKGYGEGRVGISRKHALALVNRGGATATELLALAGVITRGVEAAFGVTLVPEPVIVGG